MSNDFKIFSRNRLKGKVLNIMVPQSWSSLCAVYLCSKRSKYSTNRTYYAVSYQFRCGILNTDAVHERTAVYSIQI